jgi:quercetin dioxygenase-like cupin family protein
VTIVTISDARRFSLDDVQRSTLLREADVAVELLCFEAGQRDEEEQRDATSLYQVLEGEALLQIEGERHRLGKGKIASVPAGRAHVLENAGGGLLVVLATRGRDGED